MNNVMEELPDVPGPNKWELVSSDGTVIADMVAVPREDDKCECEKREINMKKINGFITLGWTHGMKYDGEPMVYCPWCGKKLSVASIDATTKKTDTE